MNYHITFYEKENGEKPAEEFLLSLGEKMQAKLVRNLQMLREFGPLLREPYSKSLRNGIFEVRAKQSTDITRILYFFCVGQEIVLTNGFVKKTQKTPHSEIELAEKYRDEFLKKRGLK